MDLSNLTILIPTLNEEQNIGSLIDEITELIPEAKILVVDDGSTDNTRNIVNSKNDNVSLLDRSDEDTHGLSISIIEGIQTVDTEFFMVIDGDFQHPPDSLLEAITCFEQGAELVVGYRIKVEDWPITRKIMSWGAQLLAHTSLLLRRQPRPKDIMSGFFGGKTNIIEPIFDNNKFTYKGYKILFEILKYVPKDIVIKQFGYIFKNREFGDSKIGSLQIREFVKSLFY